MDKICISIFHLYYYVSCYGFLFSVGCSHFHIYSSVWMPCSCLVSLICGHSRPVQTSFCFMVVVVIYSGWCSSSWFCLFLGLLAWQGKIYKLTLSVFVFVYAFFLTMFCLGICHILSVELVEALIISSMKFFFYGKQNNSMFLMIVDEHQIQNTTTKCSCWMHISFPSN